MTDQKLPLISIVGPTATGKTRMALSLAKSILDRGEATGVDLISADSRQVYRGFEILSGADLGDFIEMGFVWEKGPKYPYLTQIDRSLTLHGAAIIDLKSEWSLAHFYSLAEEIITQALEMKRQVIVVGGTMLYHDKLLDHNDQINVPPDNEFRAEAETWDLEKLQSELKKIAPQTWQKMNHSDQNNPRRLIRRLEVANYQQSWPKKAVDCQSLQSIKIEHQYFMPEFDLNNLKDKINQRVSLRFRGGAVDEVAAALKIIGSEDRAYLSLPLGFDEIEAYLAGKYDAQECVNLWTLHEWQYAKRQMTWWQKAGLIKRSATENNN